MASDSPSTTSNTPYGWIELGMWIGSRSQAERLITSAFFIEPACSLRVARSIERVNDPRRLFYVKEALVSDRIATRTPYCRTVRSPVCQMSSLGS